MEASAVAAVDAEVAAATLEEHVDALWATGRQDELGWKRFQLDALRWVIVMPASNAAGERTHFFVRIDGRSYDLMPVDVQFVDPHDWEPVGSGRWWPVSNPAAAPPPDGHWFGLHSIYEFPGGSKRPLVCFSFTLGYYESNHGPTEDVRWEQSRHTVAATLYRVAEILSPPFFERADIRPEATP